jgi:hypothetical protein
MAGDPRAVRLRWPKLFRIIPSKFPPINFFERIVAPEQMEAVWYLESLTNDRLRDQMGDVSLVAANERIAGPGASVVMAAFTHVGNPSRFSNGSYGVYYAARSLETAVRETAFHRARFLAATQQAPGEIDMRAYVGKPKEPLMDLRLPRFKHLHDPDDYTASQAFGAVYGARKATGDSYTAACGMKTASAWRHFAQKRSAFRLPDPHWVTSGMERTLPTYTKNRRYCSN